MKFITFVGLTAEDRFVLREVGGLVHLTEETVDHNDPTGEEPWTTTGEVSMLSKAQAVALGEALVRWGKS